MDEARRKEVERALEHDLAHPSGLWPWNAYCRELLAALSSAESRAEQADERAEDDLDRLHQGAQRPGQGLKRPRAP